MKTIVRSLLAGVVAGVAAYFIAAFRDKDITIPHYTADYTLQIDAWDSAVMKTVSSPVVEIESILRRRLEKFGHTFTSVHRIDQRTNKALLDIKVGNIRDTALMKRFLSSEGRLQIWETYQPMELSGFFLVADSVALAMFPRAQTEPTKNEQKENIAPEVRALLDSTRASRQNERKENAGITRFIDLEKGYGRFIGVVKVKDTSQCGKILRSEQVLASLPPGATLCFSLYPDKQGSLELYVIRKNSYGISPIQNKQIIAATADFDDYGRPIVSFDLSVNGARRWAEMTEKNVDKTLAIVIDDHVLSAPTVLSRIEGGRSVISGSFSVSDAETIAGIIQVPALPGRIDIVNSRVTSLKSMVKTRHILFSLLAFAVASVLAGFMFKALKST